MPGGYEYSYSYLDTPYRVAILPGMNRRSSPFLALHFRPAMMVLFNRMGLPLAVAAVGLLSNLAASIHLHEHNPTGAEVKEVHMVLSSHFDAGCKVRAIGASRRDAAAATAARCGSPLL